MSQEDDRGIRSTGVSTESEWDAGAILAP